MGSQRVGHSDLGHMDALSPCSLHLDTLWKPLVGLSAHISGGFLEASYSGEDFSRIYTEAC